MPFLIIRQDITKMNVDAIVSGGNGALRPSGGVSGQIFQAAGPELGTYCSKLQGCAPAEAIVTPGFSLEAEYVIHTVGPIWRDGNHGEEHTLRLCYRNCLAKAEELNCKSMAFPLIASGKYGYPKSEALNVAASEIEAYLRSHDCDMSVYLAVFGREAYLKSRDMFPDLEAYVDDRYVDMRADAYMDVYGTRTRGRRIDMMPHDRFSPLDRQPESPDKALEKLGKPFPDLLLEYIDASGEKDSDIYHRANISRQTFNRIKNDKDYHPSKGMVLALSIALRLDRDNTQLLLSSLGLTLSQASRMDLIVEYFITHGKYDIFEINESLYDHGEKLLGATTA